MRYDKMAAKDELPKEEQNALTTILEAGEPVKSSEFKSQSGMDIEDSGSEEAAEIVPEERVSEGLIQSWVFDKIALAAKSLGRDLLATPEDGGTYSKIEDAVWAAALAGKLGDGTPSEATAAAIQDLVSQLMQDQMPPASISDTPMDVQPVPLPDEQPVALDGEEVSIAPTEIVPEMPTALPVPPVPLGASKTDNLMKRLAERYVSESDETNVLDAADEPALDTPDKMMERLNEYHIKALNNAAAVWGTNWKTRLKEAWETQDYGDLDGLTVDCLEQIKVLTDESTSGLKAEAIPDPDSLPGDDAGSSIYLHPNENRKRRRRFETRDRTRPVRSRLDDETDLVLEHGMEAAVEGIVQKENRSE